MSAPNDIPLTFENVPHEALMNILWTGTLLKRTARTFFREAPLTEAEFNLLMVLHHSSDSLSQKDLSERLLVDKSNITGLIDRLQKSGYIMRNPVPNDRRRYDITLTEAGRKLITRADPVYHRLVDQVMDGLSERECRTLVSLTRKVRQGLRASNLVYPEGG
ncbi:MAG: MarR family transcriptional regulator [Candidatus Krumholzibacteriota bacterium]